MIATNLLNFKTLLFFQKTPVSKRVFDKAVEKEKTDFSQIRCPSCAWQPHAWDRWMCVDAGHPEYYYSACYTSWNTFETGGKCPGCHHQWRWTTCLSCENFSPHENWYAKVDS